MFFRISFSSAEDWKAPVRWEQAAKMHQNAQTRRMKRLGCLKMWSSPTKDTTNTLTSLITALSSNVGGLKEEMGGGQNETDTERVVKMNKVSHVHIFFFYIVRNAPVRYAATCSACIGRFQNGTCTFGDFLVPFTRRDRAPLTDPCEGRGSLRVHFANGA